MQQISETELARIYLQARLLRCPLGNNPGDCPLHEIRKLPMERRYEWLDRQSDEKVVRLFEKHNECIERKLAED